MTNPVPGYSITTAYRKRGPYWSCDEDAYGNGVHTGVDYAAPNGAKCVAARPGTVKHVNHGSAFGNHQLEVVASDGSADFYAHMRSRVANGTKVSTGQKVGEVGSEGNVTGAHLHFEKHKAGHTGWSCTAVTDPQPSINYQDSGGGGSSAKPEPPDQDKDDDMPTSARAKCTKPLKMKGGQWYAITWDTVTSTDKPFTSDGVAIDIPGKRFALTVSANVKNRSGGTVRTSFVELESGDIKETLEQQSHGSVDWVVDTRVGLCNDPRRMRARICCDNDATLDHALIEILYW